MKREDQAWAIVLVGGYLIVHGLDRAKALAASVQQSAANFGASIYSATHSDPTHANDLPGPQLTREAVLAIAKNAGFPDPKLAASIAMAESGGVVNAMARSAREISVGLWQINTLVHPYTVDEMRNPIKNAAAAFKISKGGTNWRPWSAFTNGRYKQFQTGILR